MTMTLSYWKEVTLVNNQSTHRWSSLMCEESTVLSVAPPLTLYRTPYTRKWSGAVISICALLTHHCMGIQWPKYCINHSEFPTGICMFNVSRLLTDSKRAVYVTHRKHAIKLSLTFSVIISVYCPLLVWNLSYWLICGHSFKMIRPTRYTDVVELLIGGIYELRRWDGAPVPWYTNKVSGRLIQALKINRGEGVIHIHTHKHTYTSKVIS
jgi:hypothetical protein